MSKYIIEIEDRPFTTPYTQLELFKAKDFNTLVFDKNGLDKLEMYEQTNKEDLADAYRDGLRDAWWAANRIVSGSSEGGLSYQELFDIFNVDCAQCNVFQKFSADEAVKLIADYEEQAKKDVRDLRKVKALADEIGKERLYNLAKDIYDPPFEPFEK